MAKFDFKRSIGLWQSPKNPEWYNSGHITQEQLKQLIQQEGKYYRFTLQYNRFKQNGDSKPNYLLFILKEDQKPKVIEKTDNETAPF
ncbi:MAG: hypothetical protein A2Y94_02025 [Caldithrix sp. RBG_13_44_9]|nr:MAG: hypothetical protein A2Y94_02025 [Caldithrix sp. RBG_13_44_9]